MPWLLTDERERCWCMWPLTYFSCNQYCAIKPLKSSVFVIIWSINFKGVSLNTRACMRMYTHACMHARTHTHTYTHTCIHACQPLIHATKSEQYSILHSWSNVNFYLQTIPFWREHGRIPTLKCQHTKQVTSQTFHHHYTYRQYLSQQSKHSWFSLSLSLTHTHTHTHTHTFAHMHTHTWVHTYECAHTHAH